MYHYIESGLDNIWLRNGFVSHQTSYGEGIAIQHLDQLHQAIGLSIAESRQKMTPKELRFLRIEMELSQKRLADLLRIDAQTVARWEKGETHVPGAAEIVIKNLYIKHSGGDPDIQKMCEDMADLDEIEFSQRREFLDDNGAWRLAG